MNRQQDCSIANNSKKTEPSEKMIFLHLPIEMVDEILSYLSYDELAKLRAVNKLFNTLCSQKLNKGFVALEQYHNKCLKAVKSCLPRRESERKNHPLARHSDILMAIETRLSMLNMTFSKYIDAQQCCFIPGKVLDEAFRVLKIVKAHAASLPSPNLPRPHDFLQEYRDISSMAMEHFDDKLLPAIRERMRTDQRLMFFKPKQIKPAPGSGSAELQGLKVNVHVSSLYGCHQLIPVYSSPGTSAMPSRPLTAESQPHTPTTSAETQSPMFSTLVHLLKDLKAKCSANKRNIWKANNNAVIVNTKLKSQTTNIRKKLDQQKAMIKYLRKELRESRNAMSIMAKDLNRLKQDQAAASGQPSCSELSSCAVISVSCLPEEVKQPAKPQVNPPVKKQPMRTRGMKRKLEDNIEAKVD